MTSGINHCLPTLAIERHNYYNQRKAHRGAIHCFNEAEIELLPFSQQSSGPVNLIQIMLA